MEDAANQPGEGQAPGEEGVNAGVGYADEPSTPRDTRDLADTDEEQPSPEDLDAREEKFTGPRKPMGPTAEEDVPQTMPEEG